jgi:hypothetical protein
MSHFCAKAEPTFTTDADCVGSTVATLPIAIVVDELPVESPPTDTLTASPLPTTLLMLVEPTTTTEISLMEPPPLRCR